MKVQVIKLKIFLKRKIKHLNHIDKNLKELNIEVPQAPDPVGAYVAFKKVGILEQSQKKEYASKLNDLKIKVSKVLEKKVRYETQQVADQNLQIDQQYYQK